MSYNKDMILGIDEVGRGPWAGPLVIGAVVLGGVEIDGLTDSKKLSKKRREELDKMIRDQAVGYGIGWVDATEIDEVGLSQALRLATRRAVEQVTVPYHEIIIDGTINFLEGTPKGQYVTTMKKADLLVPSVSAASIIAKVARDTYMESQDSVYPGYGFSSHVGYGTAAHRLAIEQLGVTPLHRLSFAPLRQYAPQPAGGEAGTGVGTVKAETVGARAEAVVAEYLQNAGHVILERNWKTKYCEIDIISQADGTLYFTEVKYRRQANQGGGMAAITPKKFYQMTFAAQMYTASHPSANQLLLAAASVTGEPPRIEDYLELR
jgi:ribonuclease HII